MERRVKLRNGKRFGDRNKLGERSKEGGGLAVTTFNNVGTRWSPGGEMTIEATIVVSWAIYVKIGLEGVLSNCQDVQLYCGSGKTVTASHFFEVALRVLIILGLYIYASLLWCLGIYDWIVLNNFRDRYRMDTHTSHLTGWCWYSLLPALLLFAKLRTIVCIHVLQSVICLCLSMNGLEYAWDLVGRAVWGASLNYLVCGTTFSLLKKNILNLEDRTVLVLNYYCS